MKTNTKRISAVILCLLMLVFCALPAGAASPFDDDAFASVVTTSDVQDAQDKAYVRYEKVLSLMKADGLETPHSVLVGGDFTKVLFDDANPGVELIRQKSTSVYPRLSPDSIVCILGNHDNPVVSLTETGFYDMGAYCLYAVNEDDFPWLQYFHSGTRSNIKVLAKDMEKRFETMIENGDTRPVIVLTHVPLHHTSRAEGGDNIYSSYIFDVLNAAAEKLDVVFLFGHNHSSDVDDYIGGSVNFMRAGEEIRIPNPDKRSTTEYLTRTLNFTYANCGYIGYSKNSVSDTSTNVLTVGCIRISENGLRFVKYTENGLYSVEDVARKNPGSVTGDATSNVLKDPSLWGIFHWLYTKFNFLVKFFFSLMVY